MKNLFYIFMLSVLLFETAAFNTIDHDFWARLLQGDAFWETGAVMKHDPFSYTQTHLWIDHEWGSSAVFSFILNNFGFSGILIFKTLLVLLIFCLIFKTIRLNTDKNSTLLNIIMFSAAVPAMPVITQSGLRCHFFTFFFFALFIYILELVRKKGNKKLLFFIPPLFAVWFNMHGGCVSGLGLLFIYALGEAVNKKPFKHYFITLAASLAAMFINPYGIDYIKFVFSAALMPRPYITEWISPFLHPDWRFMMPFKILYIVYAVLVILNFFKGLLQNRRLNPLSCPPSLQTKQLSLLPLLWRGPARECAGSKLKEIPKQVRDDGGFLTLLVILNLFQNLFRYLIVTLKRVQGDGFSFRHPELVSGSQSEEMLVRVQGDGKPNSYDYTKLLLLVILAFISMRNIKSSPFFIIVSMIFLYDYIAAMPLFSKTKSVMQNFFTSAACVIIAAAALFIPASSIKNFFFLSEQPFQTIDFIKKNKLKGRLIAPMDMGSYIAYKLYPDILIYMDGRYEEVYFKETKEMLDNFFNIKENWHDILKDNPEFIIIPYDAAVNDLMAERKDYRVIWKDKNLLYSRNDILKPVYKLPSKDYNYYIKTAFEKE